DLDHREQLDRTGTGLLGAHVGVRAQRLDDLETYGVDGVERRDLPGADDGALVTADLAQLRVAQPDELLARELRAALRAPVGRQEADEGHRGLRLARPGLADDRDDLTGVHLVGDVLGGGVPLAVDPEVDAEALDAQ